MVNRTSLTSFGFVLILFAFISCAPPAREATSEKQKVVSENNQTFDWQGHRGARGLMPENTIPAFIKALELGMQTLELDVVISKDKKVVLSHEPILSSEICLDPSENEIEEGKEWNIYKMEYTTIAKCDCGSKPNKRFPQQEKIRVAKPLLSAVIDSVEQYVAKHDLPKPFYNIETKATPEGDGKYHPAPEEFVDLLMEVLIEKGMIERTYLQSFDVRTLQVAQQKYPEVKLVLLVGNEDSAEKNLQKLGFTPQVYSPYYKLVNEALVAFIHNGNMQLIPWTVNTVEEIQQLKTMGVDGVITDYPNLRSEIE